MSGGEPIEIPGAVSPSIGRHWAAFTPNGDFIFTDTSWSIVAVDRTGSTRVLASGGSDDVGVLLAGPAASPSGKFVTWSDFPNNPSPVGSWIFRTGSSEPDKLMEASWIHTITTSGHALFIRGNVLQPQQTIAVPMDLDSGALLGEEVAIGVWSAAISPSGLLVFEDLSDQEQDQPSEFYRVTSSGATERMLILPGVSSQEIAISGDGFMLAVSARAEEGANPDMYIVNLTLETVTRLTRGGTYDIPAWGSEDKYLYFDCW